MNGVFHLTLPRGLQARQGKALWEAPGHRAANSNRSGGKLTAVSEIPSGTLSAAKELQHGVQALQWRGGHEEKMMEENSL